MSDFQFAPAAYQDPAPEGVASLDPGPSLPGATLRGVERVARTVLPRSVMDSTTKGLALRSISAARSCVLRFVMLLMSATAVGALAREPPQDLPETWSEALAIIGIWTTSE